MNEYVVITYIIETLEKVAKEQNLTAISSVTIELGEISPYKEDAVMDCWEFEHTKSELLKNTKLKIEMIKALSVCDDCEKTYDPKENARKCPYCGGYFTHLLSGEEFNIKEIEAC